jgi:hypothetical protein
MESATYSVIAGVLIEKDRMQFVAVAEEQESRGGEGLAVAGATASVEEARKTVSTNAIDLRTGTPSQSLFSINNSLSPN